MSEHNVLTDRAVLPPGSRLVLPHNLAIDLYGGMKLGIVAVDSFYLLRHSLH